MTAIPKPPKGSDLIRRRKIAKTIRDYEKEQKQIVRLRDRRCRWPHCENCRVYKPRLEVAHLTAKGSGGDHGTRSAADRMVLLDHLTHQGAGGLERHERKIVPLTDRGTFGPCEFWKWETGTGWYLVAKERAPFIYERD